MNTKIGILYICTGNYILFWKEFYSSMEKNFIGDAEKHYFVFTDSPNIEFEKDNPRIHRIYQSDLGWPYNTLMRFHIFLKYEEELMEMDYLFFCNANLLVLEKVTGEELLPKNSENLVATLHPGNYNRQRSRFPYDKNKKSTAYIASSDGMFYFAGGLNGGKTIAFIDAMKNMRTQVDIDQKNTIIARWHDESHWNKYLVGRTDLKILSPSYLYPEGKPIPLHPIILVRDKNKYGGHNILRNKKNTFFSVSIKMLKKIVSKILMRIPAFDKLIIYYKKRAVSTQGLPINNTPLLVITIAFNNIDILKVQHQYLKNNLKEKFVYMIADNSSLPNISKNIELYCKDEKIPYVKLPPNPYRSPSKSHGIALNWAYRNIVKYYTPVYFGFIDHDIFPYKETSVTNNIQQEIWGLVQERGNRWYLWPGFCFFDFEKLKNKKMNFMPSYGLDSGGANYYTLYKNMDKNVLAKISQVYINTDAKKIVSNINNQNTATAIECIGDWIHLMRASNWNIQKNNKTSIVEKIVLQVKEIL